MKNNYYKVAVSWTETGTVSVKANSIESAIKKVEEDVDSVPLPDSEYLNDSFQVDRDTTLLLNRKLLNRIRFGIINNNETYIKYRNITKKFSIGSDHYKIVMFVINAYRNEYNHFDDDLTIDETKDAYPILKHLVEKLPIQF